MKITSMKYILAMVLGASGVCGDLLGLPTVPFQTTKGSYNLKSTKNIIVDSKFATTKDTDGWTLIPPSLDDFAQTFAKDFSKAIRSDAAVTKGASANTKSIFLTTGNHSGFTDVAGRWTSEAYAINVTSSGVTILGASPLGVWWGTRTVLQQAALNNGKIAVGLGVDAPGWNTRGLFLDGGRHYYPPSFVVEMCAWMSFWKQNTFHLHLSDNLYNNPNYTTEQRNELYARFRLLSDDSAVQGLNKHANESYTQRDFDHMQSACAARGVTIIPEIEAPGHALVISQWKPQLGLEGAADLLNITYPETIPTMGSIWKTFLPWFQSKAVHIGADEYVDDSLTTYELGQDYNKFVNAMDGYIAGESGKSMRIWGTYPPMKNYTANVYKNVTVQHWEFFEDYPYQDYIENGYDVINSDDHTYIVNKYSTSYPQQLNRTLIFYGDPTSGAFAPNIFDPNNATNNPPRDNPRVVGHIAAQWNDYGYNTSTFLEAYYSWRGLNPALADKQWGGNATDAQYDALFAALQPAAPGQNLDRTVRSKGATIFEYKLSGKHSKGSGGKNTTIKDHSGNTHDAKTNCAFAKSGGALQFKDGCDVTTPLSSKGRDYTLSFQLRPSSSKPGPLFTGRDSQLLAGNGSSTQITMVSAGYGFPLNYTLPVGKWTEASLIARGNRTFFAVDGGKEMEFLTKIGVNGDYFAWREMAFEAPLKTIGGGEWEGEMKSVRLVKHARSSRYFAACKSIGCLL